ncbi:MAG: formate/nitrite transporter family protein [Myxococcales bacterium]|nr:formate/nitrite transporter family protein [Myxococcales bacterium]
MPGDADTHLPDALLPAAMAVKAESLGVLKATMPAATAFVLAVLAGAFIALGAVFATTVATGAAGEVPWGLARLASGLAFSLGLILVVVGGAELFTGNTLIVMAWLGGRVQTPQVLRSWAVVYAGNIVGALGTAALVWAAGWHKFAGGAVGETLVASARLKLDFGFGQAIALGVLCNALVCLAVWLSFSARSTADRILSVMLPIACFVAAGFEHCVADWFVLPLAAAITGEAAVGDLNLVDILVRNILPVTIGNLIGGVGLVGGVYWFVYLRNRPT